MSLPTEGHRGPQCHYYNFFFFCHSYDTLRMRIRASEIQGHIDPISISFFLFFLIKTLPYNSQTEWCMHPVSPRLRLRQRKPEFRLGLQSIKKTNKTQTVFLCVQPPWKSTRRYLVIVVVTDRVLSPQDTLEEVRGNKLWHRVGEMAQKVNVPAAETMAWVRSPATM